MFGYIVLALLGAWFLFTIISPTWRRIWAFQLYAYKALFLWLAGALHLAPKRTRPELLRLFCEDLGPTFIKFGQIVASSAGMFPKRYIAEFQKCLDRVRPFEFVEVERILGEELGDQASRLTELDPKQLASASIAQVHTAKLDGKDVVVKVQRPGIQARVDADMRIMRFVAGLAEMWVKDAELVNPVGIVDDFAATLREELDFRKEADNLDQFNEIMAKLGHANVRSPVPVRDMTTVRVLVMERFYGTRVDDVEKMKSRGVDAENKLIAGMKAWFQCVLFYGFFHGDVHAGNLMLLDNEDIGFLDFGIVGRFSDKQRAMVTDYIVAFAMGDYKGLAKIIVSMGGVHEKIDMEGFSKDLEQAYSPMLKLSFAEINYGEMLPTIQKVASKHRMKLPKEFVLITKQMLYFDRYAKLLAPSLNVFTDPRLVASMMMDIQKAKMEMMAAAAKA
jgi:predicted unusual protein kinase regulating ubiquinone biosynthesis (AarF/ABC1/UbiB family)